MTNCINCGAPLHGNKCQYCGTEYNENGFVCRFDKGEIIGSLNINGKEFRVYLSDVEGHTIDLGVCRDKHGRVKPKMFTKRTFTLIEY